MLISKFNLYKTEWLDLVFDDRNKEYGAYNLRREYAGNMVKAMSITFFGIGVLCAATIIFKGSPPPAPLREIPVDITPHVYPPVKQIKKPELPHPVKPLKAEPPKPMQTIKNPTPVVAPDALAEKPVRNIDLVDKISGQTTSLHGTTGVNVEVPVDKPTEGGGTGKPDNSVHPTFGLDVMPEPVGGLDAWSKFLNKNLRFPIAAQEEGISGKVFLSFIIEKDGTLSNITVDRPAGHGFDEEALRVLKLAKAWKPGQQNGQAVRVKYSIPINFQLSE